MALKPTAKRGLRVFHNSNTAQKATVTVPAGAELTVDVEVAGQLVASSSHFEVDPGEMKAARAEADREAAELAKASAEARFRDDHRVKDEPPAEPAKPVKRTAKKAAPKSDI